MILIFISCIQTHTHTQSKYIWPFVAFIHKHLPHTQTHLHKKFDTRHGEAAINYPGPDRQLGRGHWGHWGRRGYPERETKTKTNKQNGRANKRIELAREAAWQTPRERVLWHEEHRGGQGRRQEAGGRRSRWETFTGSIFATKNKRLMWQLNWDRQTKRRTGRTHGYSQETAQQ